MVIVIAKVVKAAAAELSLGFSSVAVIINFRQGECVMTGKRQIKKSFLWAKIFLCGVEVKNLKKDESS